MKTYSQRMMEARTAENELRAKQVALEKNRTRGFGVNQEIGTGVGSVQGSAEAQLSSLEGGGQFEEPTKASIWTTTTAASTIPAAAAPNPFITSFDNPGPSNPIAANSIAPRSQDPSAAASGGFDTFSQHHLSRRILPHTTLSRALQQKTISLLPDLLKTIVSPAYEPPECDGDWVIMGIISAKSDPRQTTKTHNASKINDPTSGGDKYMVMTLTDLKWDIELFLFGAGFERFWKVGVGTVVAILNPGVMRPRNADSGKFSLTLNSSDDTLLEIGTARDLGFCKSVKRDGKNCGAWVDKRRMEHCAFHCEMAVKKTAGNRMELNNMGKMFSPPKKGSLRPQQKFLHRGGGEGRG